MFGNLGSKKLFEPRELHYFIDQSPPKIKKRTSQPGGQSGKEQPKATVSQDPPMVSRPYSRQQVSHQPSKESPIYNTTVSNNTRGEQRYNKQGAPQQSQIIPQAYATSTPSGLSQRELQDIVTQVQVQHTEKELSATEQALAQTNTNLDRMIQEKKIRESLKGSDQTQVTESLMQEDVQYSAVKDDQIQLKTRHDRLTRYRDGLEAEQGSSYMEGYEKDVSGIQNYPAMDIDLNQQPATMSHQSAAEKALDTNQQGTILDPNLTLTDVSYDVPSSKMPKWYSTRRRFDTGTEVGIPSILPEVGLAFGFPEGLSVKVEKTSHLIPTGAPHLSSEDIADIHKTHGEQGPRPSKDKDKYIYRGFQSGGALYDGINKVYGQPSVPHSKEDKEYIDWFLTASGYTAPVRSSSWQDATGELLDRFGGDEDKLDKYLGAARFGGPVLSLRNQFSSTEIKYDEDGNVIPEWKGSPLSPRPLSGGGPLDRDMLDALVDDGTITPIKQQQILSSKITKYKKPIGKQSDKPVFIRNEGVWERQSDKPVPTATKHPWVTFSTDYAPPSSFQTYPDSSFDQKKLLGVLVPAGTPVPYKSKSRQTLGGLISTYDEDGNESVVRDWNPYAITKYKRGGDFSIEQRIKYLHQDEPGVQIGVPLSNTLDNIKATVYNIKDVVEKGKGYLPKGSKDNISLNPLEHGLALIQGKLRPNVKYAIGKLEESIPHVKTAEAHHLQEKKLGTQPQVKTAEAVESQPTPFGIQGFGPTPIGGEDNVGSRFVGGIYNQAVDYQAITNPDYEHKSILNQAIDLSLKGEFGAAGTLIQDNPVRFAGNVAMEAGTFIVPVGAALKVAKGTSIAIRQSQRIPNLTETVVSKVTGKPKRESLWQAVGTDKQGNPYSSPWFSRQQPEPNFLYKSGLQSEGPVVVKELKMTPARAKHYSANTMRREYKYSERSEPVSAFYTTKSLQNTDVIVGDVRKLGFQTQVKRSLGGKTYASSKAARKELEKSPMGGYLKRYRLDSYVLAPLSDQRKAKVVATINKDSGTQDIANILTRTGQDKKELRRWLNKPSDVQKALNKSGLGVFTDGILSSVGVQVNSKILSKVAPEFSVGLRTRATRQELFERKPTSKIRFDPILSKMNKKHNLQKFIPFAVVQPVLGVTQKTSSLRRKKKRR